MANADALMIDQLINDEDREATSTQSTAGSLRLSLRCDSHPPQLPLYLTIPTHRRMGCELRQVVPIARMELGALDVDLILGNAVYVLPRLLHRWLLLRTRPGVNYGLLGVTLLYCKPDFTFFADVIT